jgi:hypothetical protein
LIGCYLYLIDLSLTLILPTYQPVWTYSTLSLALQLCTQNIEMFRLLPILIVLAAGQLGDARKFVISNQCKAPVWAAYTAVSGANGITVNGKAGTGMWLQPAGQKDELDVPEECECFPTSEVVIGLILRSLGREILGGYWL